MVLLSSILVGLVALEHLYILYLEMFAWTTARVRRIFGTTLAFAEESRALAANQDLALVGWDESVDEPEERGLPAAAGAHDTDELALRDVKADVLDRLEPAFLEGLADMAERDQRSARGHRRPLARSFLSGPHFAAPRASSRAGSRRDEGSR